MAYKGQTPEALERLYIYKVAKQGPIMNEQFATESNILFDLLVSNEK
jgi:hypothetical protein